MNANAASRIPPLLTREFWFLAATYLLFLSSLWTIVGMGLAVAALHVVVLYHLARTPVEDWLPRWVWVPFVALLAWATFVSILADDAGGSFARMLRHHRLFLPLVLLPALARTELRRLIGVHAAVACVMAIYGVAEYGWGVDFYREVSINPYHASGTFDMYHTFAGVNLMAAPVYLSLATAVRGRERLLWAGAGGMAVLAVVVSLGRAGWLGLTAALLVLCLRLPRRYAVPIVSAALAGIVLLALVVMSGNLRDFIGQAAGNTVAGRLQTFEQADEDQRLLLWDAALRAIRDAPLLGHGLTLDAYQAYLAVIRAERGLTLAQLPPRNPHNTYLEFAYYLGIPGLLVFLSVWIAVLAWCIQWMRRAGDSLPWETSLLWGITAALCGSMVDGFFGAQWVDAEVQVNILMWMGVGLYTGLSVRKRIAGR
jgi:O-antigen ligase